MDIKEVITAVISGTATDEHTAFVKSELTARATALKESAGEAIKSSFFVQKA